VRNEVLFPRSMHYIYEIIPYALRFILLYEIKTLETRVSRLDLVRLAKKPSFQIA